MNNEKRPALYGLAQCAIVCAISYRETGPVAIKMDITDY